MEEHDDGVYVGVVGHVVQGAGHHGDSRLCRARRFCRPVFITARPSLHAQHGWQDWRPIMGQKIGDPPVCRIGVDDDQAEGDGFSVACFYQVRQPSSCGSESQSTADIQLPVERQLVAAHVAEQSLLRLDDEHRAAGHEPGGLKEQRCLRDFRE